MQIDGALRASRLAMGSKRGEGRAVLWRSGAADVQSTSDTRPKPIQLIGRRPLLWRVMCYYADTPNSFSASVTGRSRSLGLLRSHPDLVGDWRINFAL